MSPACGLYLPYCSHAAIHYSIGHECLKARVAYIPTPSPTQTSLSPYPWWYLTPCSFRRYYSADEGTSFDAYLARFDSDAKGGVSPRAKKIPRVQSFVKHEHRHATNAVSFFVLFCFFLGGGGGC